MFNGYVSGDFPHQPSQPLNQIVYRLCRVVASRRDHVFQLPLDPVHDRIGNQGFTGFIVVRVDKVRMFVSPSGIGTPVHNFRVIPQHAGLSRGGDGGSTNFARSVSRSRLNSSTMQG
jgi:hypothetical protein